MADPDSDRRGTPAEVSAAQASGAFIKHYFRHDTAWCLRACDPAFTLVGSTANVQAEGIAAFQQLMEDEVSHLYHGLVGPVETSCTELADGGIYLVRARFLVASDPLSGQVVANQNRATLLWRQTPDGLRLLHMHFSMPYSVTSATSAPTDINRETYRYAKALLDQVIRRSAVTIRDVHGGVHYLSAAEVLSIEASRQRSIVHALNGDIVVRRGFKELVSAFGDELVCVHRSFAVSPLHVKEVRGDAVLMDDGSEVPLPQRRSAEVRRQLDDAIRKHDAGRALKEAPPPIFKL